MSASFDSAHLRSITHHFETAEPREILRWALDVFGDTLCMATAFGPEGCILLHELAALRDETGRLPYIFNLDTGYQFPETLALRERIQARYGIAVELVGADLSAPEFEAANGGPVYLTDPDRCCHERKVVPLRRVLHGRAAWISAIRREQTVHRAAAGIVEWDRQFNVVKVNPLANWTRSQVWKYILKHDIPYNPLHDQGFGSIGCWPCTRPIGAGDDERAGRWAGRTKTECGLHLRPQEPLVQLAAPLSAR
jgi:phosphoadenosine phosphosulfate reductase